MISSACFDLETTNLSADFGVILCACIKPAHGRMIVLRGDELCPTWKRGRSNDKQLVEAIANCLKTYDILVAHNGLRFDIPFLRTRLARWGLPPFPAKKLLDPVQVARRNLRMSGNSLDRIGDLLIASKKTPVTGETWLAAALDGSKRAMDYIVDHCRKDVLMLCELVDHLKSYSPTFNSFGSY
jgi:uncharacterized protein YprB with RNaseH-like and TPR domain